MTSLASTHCLPGISQLVYCVLLKATGFDGSDTTVCLQKT